MLTMFTKLLKNVRKLFLWIQSATEKYSHSANCKTEIMLERVLSMKANRNISLCDISIFTSVYKFNCLCYDIVKTSLCPNLLYPFLILFLKMPKWMVLHALYIFFSNTLRFRRAWVLNPHKSVVRTYFRGGCLPFFWSDADFSMTQIRWISKHLIFS